MALLLRSLALAGENRAVSRAARAMSSVGAEAAIVEQPAVEAGSNSSASTAAPQGKFKNHFKRASSVMADVSREADIRMVQKMMYFRPSFPAFNVGDAVELQYANEMNETNPVPIRGTVISKTRKGPDSKFTLLNSLDDEWYTATYPAASPLLRTMRVMMRNRHSEGLKDPRRAKLNYLLGADPTVYSVDSHTKEASERQAEKIARRALLKTGKAGKKSEGKGTGNNASGGSSKKVVSKKK